MFRDFIKGFCFALVFAVFFGILGVLFLSFNPSSKFDIGEAFGLILILTIFVLIFSGVEMVTALLFAWETPFYIKIMNSLGALCAVALAYIMAPMILDIVSASKPEPDCKASFKQEIGSISVSIESCEAPQ